MKVIWVATGVGTMGHGGSQLSGFPSRFCPRGISN